MSQLFIKKMMENRSDIKDWKDAVYAGVDILVKNGYAKKELATAIFDSTSKHGAYYVLERGIALLHATPADYAKKVGVSFMLLDKEIQFNNEDKYARLIFTLSAPDHLSHIEIIKEFGQLFTNNETKRKIFEAKNTNDILKILQEIKE